MKRIRILIADDSATVRSTLNVFMSQQPNVEVVGQACDGIEAVAMCETLQPDVILMDAQMPVLDGFEATERIMARTPSRILMICSVDEKAQVEACFRAMSAGALEVVAKPREREADIFAWPRRVLKAISLVAEIPFLTRRPLPATPTFWKEATGRIDAWGLVASTGGPPVLARILGNLPIDFPVPVLIAQHIAPGFGPGLLRWFASATPLQMFEATAGMRCLPGHIYMAPDGHDLEVDRHGRLSTPASPGGFCPSGDRLLHSLAAAYGAGAGGIVLTGMGEDGADGLLAIRANGGVTLAQDEASSVVFGMPQAAMKMGAVNSLLPPEAIAMAIRGLTRGLRVAI